MQRLRSPLLFRSVMTVPWVLLTLAGMAQAQSIEQIDDAGRAVYLDAPARRVITLTPHITEMVFAAGGGDRLVATVSASDYPPAAQKLPRVGDGLHPSPEQVAKYRPDLVMGWMPMQVEYLEPLNVPVFISAPMNLDDIPDTIETIGVLLGTREIASAKAQSLRDQLQRLAKPSAPGSRPVRVLIQLGTSPEFSLNDSHILSDVIRLCGGINVFGDSPAVAPRISTESILASKPDLVIIGTDKIAKQADVTASARAFWKKAGLQAAMNDHLHSLDADVIFRPGPRLIEQAATICQLIEQART